jgi:hypothetical protein
MIARLLPWSAYCCSVRNISLYTMCLCMHNTQLICACLLAYLLPGAESLLTIKPVCC